MTTIYTGLILDVPHSPFTGGTLRAETCALAVSGGVITYRGPLAQAQATYPNAQVIRLEGVLIPGMIDTHVHYPQLPIIGSLGMPLLDWLEECALPQEARLADVNHARDLAQVFLASLARAGTTSALVFGSHYASAMDVFFDAAAATGLRITSGLVVSDRLLREDLHTTPERARAEASALIESWHGLGHLRYAVTPRFSLSASDAILEACADTFTSTPGVFFTSHVNENKEEVRVVRELFPEASSYTDTYARFGLLTERSVLAHNVHPSTAELTQIAHSGATVAHCPTSNSALGSGLFPLSAHLDAGVRVALGSDVGAGTGFSLFKEGLQAHFHQRLQPDGYPLTPTHLLYLATRAGALALDLPNVGHFEENMAFDAVHVRPASGSTFAEVFRHATSDTAALASIFTLGTDADIANVWVNGVTIDPGVDPSATVHN